MKFISKLCQERAEKLEKSDKPEKAVRWYLWAKNIPMAEKCAAAIKSPEGRIVNKEPIRAQAYALIAKSYKKPETKIKMLIRASDEVSKFLLFHDYYARDYLISAGKVALKNWKSLPGDILEELIIRKAGISTIVGNNTYPERLDHMIGILRSRNSY